MSNGNGSHAPTSVFQYQLLRNTTSPDEQETGVRSYVANVLATKILDLSTEANLRDYIPEYNPRKRSRVHEAIRDTIETEPTRFITRNSGVVVTASDIDVDDQAKRVTLTNPSILNGSQTQGEIRHWINETFGDELPSVLDRMFYVRVEIIVDPDEDEVVETAIARNTATPVKSISQAGKRGQLDELAASIRGRHPDVTIRMSETDSDSAFDTRKILQWTRLLMPVSVSGDETASEKLRAYKNPEQCLIEFCEWQRSKDSDSRAKAKYDFTVQMAPFAMDEYAYWEKHPAWQGQRLWEQTKKGGRACRRDKKSGKVVWVSPGLIFPIVGAVSEFVTEKNGKWRIEKPSLFRPGEMIEKAVDQFRGLDSDPMRMGRAVAAYDALRIYPRTIVEVMQSLEGAVS